MLCVLRPTIIPWFDSTVNTCWPSVRSKDTSNYQRIYCTNLRMTCSSLMHPKKFSIAPYQRPLPHQLPNGNCETFGNLYRVRILVQYVAFLTVFQLSHMHVCFFVLCCSSLCICFRLESLQEKDADSSLVAFVSDQSEVDSIDFLSGLAGR